MHDADDRTGSYPRRNAVTQRFSLGAPRTIIVSRDGSKVLFARSAAGDDPVNKLWVIDLPDTEPRLLVDPVELLGGADVELTDAEKARRERAREAGGGIVTYTIHSDHNLAAFVLGGRLFCIDIGSGETTELAAAPGAFDPRISPDGAWVAYFASGALRRVATDGSDSDELIVADESADPAVTWGAAEFVAAEEMGRSRGFWWAPDSRRLLVARVDTSAVAIWHISEPVDASIEPRSIPYPAAGTTNADVQLFVVDADGTEPAVPVDWRRDEFEYVARAAWTSRAGITLTVQPRDQKTTVVLDVDPESGASTELARATDPGWSELVSGVPVRNAAGLITVADDHETDTRRLFLDGVAISPPGLQIRNVSRVGTEAVFVLATDEPTERHVWRIPLDGSAPEQLTTEPGIHAHAGHETTRVVTSSDMADTRSVAKVHSTLVDEPFVIESFAERPDLDFDVRFHTTTDRELRSALVLPADHDGSPLPVLLDPYGGPHALRVQRARSAFSASQWFADQGFAVIVTDGAGTPARGPRFEQQVLGDLATLVLQDQVDALHHLADEHVGLFDLTRVGIRGWSFGGYLAALAVLRRPDVFHAGVAGAPVTDWRLYDTHYTERYLGHPDEDPGAYDRTDLCTMAADLTRPLMIIHGLADDNVVAAHSFKLSRALLEAGRPHQVLPLSGVSHMTPQESVAENLLRLQVAFLHDALAP